MKAPEWLQTVLLLTDDLEIESSISPSFGPESQFLTVKTTEEAIAQLDLTPTQVLIIDTKTTDPKRQYFEETKDVPFIELSQYASQLNLGLTIILLVNKLSPKDGDFARKCGASLIMDRKNILSNRMVYLIGVLRKRTFRTILTRDLPANISFNVDLYHYMTMGNRYAVFLPAGTPLGPEKIEKFKSSNIRHLFIKESDLGSFLNTLRSTQDSELFSELLASIRNQFRQLLIQLFDLSTDGMIHFGKHIYDQGLEIVTELDKLIDRFPDPQTCLSELPYPRWSVIAHSINCGIYSLILSRHCKLEPRIEIAFAAMIHNIGLSEINQNIIKKNESEMDPVELEEYKKHVTISIEILRKKLITFTPLIETILLHHHENFDGTGFPHGLASNLLPVECSFVSVIGSFDYFNTVRPGEKAKTVKEAWIALKSHHGLGSTLNKKFHPSLMVELDHFFT